MSIILYPCIGIQEKKGPNPGTSDPDRSELYVMQCMKYPYRRIVGQLMYGMVHTMVSILYALNVLSRYGNNPGPRHIKFLKDLL